MELTDKQKNYTMAIVAGLSVVAFIIVVAQAFRSYVGSRAPIVPPISEAVIGGRLTASKITVGQHTLQFKAKTPSGAMVTEQVTFTAERDPYTTAGTYTPY